MKHLKPIMIMLSVFTLFCAAGYGFIMGVARYEQEKNRIRLETGWISPAQRASLCQDERHQAGRAADLLKIALAKDGPDRLRQQRWAAFLAATERVLACLDKVAGKPATRPSAQPSARGRATSQAGGNHSLHLP